MFQFKQKFSPTFVRKFKRHLKIGRFLYKNPWAFKIIKRLAAAGNSLVNSYIRRQKFINFREVSERANVEEHGYTDKYGDLRVAVLYASEIHSPEFGPDSLGESYALYESQKKLFSKFVETEKPDFVFNFGICYAHIDAYLAKKYPNTKFSGIDLTPYNKAFNDIEFSNIPNLEVMHGDFFKALDNHSFSNGCFWHSRTLTLLPLSFAEQLYAKCRDLGFKYIIGYEQNGLNEDTVAPYTYGPEEKDSLYWRDNMYIHNYIGLCEKFGYEVTMAEMFETGHTSDDYRMLKYIARLK